jgi:hypothetical protein
MNGIGAIIIFLLIVMGIVGLVILGIGLFGAVAGLLKCTLIAFGIFILLVTGGTCAAIFS